MTGDLVALVFLVAICAAFGLPSWWCLVVVILGAIWLRVFRLPRNGKGGRS